MKKVLLVVAVAFAAISFSSCKKECMCRENGGKWEAANEGLGGDISKDQCKALNTLVSAFGEGECEMR